MERIHEINPNRIQWCCNDSGISPAELSSSVNISQRTMEQVLSGEGSITFNQLKKIATYFNRGVLFFLETESVNEERIHSQQFRTIANQKPELDAKIKALIERVERQREVFLSLRADLGNEEENLFQPPAIRNLNIKQAAGSARTWLGLGETNTFESYRQAVETNGILVFRSNGYNGPWQIAKESPICGFSLYDPKCPVILIKKQPRESRQVFTLMHELGHFLLQKDSSIDEEEDLYSHEGKERDANAFAGNLLVPDGFLAMIDDAERPETVEGYDNWLRQFRGQWSVSGEVILRRLLDNGRLEQNHYQAYREWKKSLIIPESEGGTRLYRHREPNHVFGKPFVCTVLDALSARHISLSKASTFLDNLKIKDIHKLEHYFLDNLKIKDVHKLEHYHAGV